MPRAFDCPRTDVPCTSDGCTVLHCEAMQRSREERGMRVVRTLPPIPEGFTPWTGGDPPPGLAPDSEITVIFARGARGSYNARHLDWVWNGRETDIIGWRQVLRTPAPVGDEWVDCTGNNRPISGVCEVEFNNGVIETRTAEDLDWARGDGHFIVRRYRRVPVVPFVLPEGFTRNEGHCPELQDDDVIEIITSEAIRPVTHSNLRSVRAFRWTQYPAPSNNIEAYRIIRAAPPPPPPPPAPETPPAVRLSAVAQALRAEMPQVLADIIRRGLRDTFGDDGAGGFGTWLADHRAACARLEADED